MRPLIVLVPLVYVACGTINDSNCESARSTIIAAMQTICSGDAQSSGYLTSKFCTKCVIHGWYSTTGASACQCQELTFDTAECAYETGEGATAAVRAAIDWADSQCADFAPPTAILPVPEASVEASAVQAEGGSAAGGE
jgi:hypothetical protein